MALMTDSTVSASVYLEPIHTDLPLPPPAPVDPPLTDPVLDEPVEEPATPEEGEP